MVGRLVRLKKPCLNNPEGTLGVCYEEYVIGDSPGLSYIFANGEYDGFDRLDQELFLETVGFCFDVARYKFKNVGQLTLDFEAGYFDAVFKPNKEPSS